MYIILLISLCIGINNGIKFMHSVRHGNTSGVSPSGSLLEFVFLNK